jgi:competence protein ComEC
LAVNQRISERLPLEEDKTARQLSGVIGGLPEVTGDGLRFLFLPEVGAVYTPKKIQVYWYKKRHVPKDSEAGPPRIHAGERWQLQLVLRAARGRVNFHGVDAERWYFSEGIDALAHVADGDNVRLSGPSWFDLQHWRERVLDKLAETAGEKPAFRVLAALAVADRRGLLKRDRAILSATGTGHLLAISGLHIGLAAVMGFYLGRLGLLLLWKGLQQRLAVAMPWVTAWLAAFAYSALAGFGVSTQRALIMLTVASVAILCRRNIHPLQAWLIAMSLVLVADPFAPLRAGFWLSFVAVGVLMMLFIPRFGHVQAWRRMLFAQLGISLVMAPIGMFWFQQVSLPGLMANLVAIPVVSLLIVPLILASLVLFWLPGPLASWTLSFAAYAAHWLMLLLDRLSGLQPPAFGSTAAPGLPAVVLAMLGAAVLMLPRGAPGRAAGLLLMLPLLFPAGVPRGDTETRIDFLDVGQGLSVLLTTPGHLMVYDTGPGNGLPGEAGLDMVDGTIQPMIEATGRKPDLVIVSHADLDHAGGLARLMSEFPGAEYLANLRENRPDTGPCRVPRHWSWDGLQFRILHPSPGLPYRGNDSSCVVSVAGPGISLLLTGDISQVVEQRLVREGLEPHAILTAPHHGSSTSSSQALIDAVSPTWSIISAASGNRFGFPRADVIERYANARVPTLNSAECGGIRMITDQTGTFRIQSARVMRNAIWRWPAAQNCP